MAQVTVGAPPNLRTTVEGSILETVVQEGGKPWRYFQPQNVSTLQQPCWRRPGARPTFRNRPRQIGRRVGQDIVQIGTRPDGTPTRWTFSEITANSFHWTGEALNPDGRTWRLEGDFRVTRMR